MGSSGFNIFVFVVSLFCGSFASNNGLGLLPPMGWNTWCTDGYCGRDVCNEDEIKSVADAMVNSGLYSLGYQYINLDDCWADSRDEQGNIQADPSRFPDGMKAVADYLHSKGLKFGLYTDAGEYTCSSGGRDHKIPGSYGHYQQDAKTYASWGMDYVKMDWCNTKINGTQLDPRIQYPQMSMALNATGRPIFFNTCEWGVDSPWTWASKIANSWRTGQDHHDNWNSTAAIIEANAKVASFAGVGGWNDPDFLMTGGEGCKDNTTKICPGQTIREYKTEFSIWCIMAAPLIVATDIRVMDEKKKEILMNSEMIAINQDKLAIAGGRVGNWNCSEGPSNCQIWAKPLYGGSVAIGLYNAGTKSHHITVDFNVIGWSSTTKASIYDLWAHQNLGVFTGSFTARVHSHGTFVIKAVKQSK